jgi:hypothetical protein
MSVGQEYGHGLAGQSGLYFSDFAQGSSHLSFEWGLLNVCHIEWQKTDFSPVWIFLRDSLSILRTQWLASPKANYTGEQGGSYSTL